ncbi:MAG TPA: two-component regulator propeller domain-containing protein, partial [Saprospiraceae bacterium]|nr:two-component regulator propeller domain-containing protein [Saprospiraceae bacterium]
MNYSPPFIRLAYWVASLLVALVPLRLAAQFKYEVLNNTHGLSQGYVFDILQDREGFLWFTTKDGLNRYDGYQFKVFSHDAYDSTSISDNSCISLFEDRYGRIWIGTEANGISVYDKETDRFFRIGQKEGVAHSLSGNRIQYPFIEMRDGRIMTCTHRNKINLITLPPNAHKQKVEIKIEELDIPFDYYNLVF